MMRSKLAVVCLTLLLLVGCAGEADNSQPEAAPAVEDTPDQTGESGEAAPSEIAGQEQDHFSKLEVELEDLREILQIPGMSAGVLKDQELVWAKGFGYADLGNEIPATPDTPYHLASVTKPIAATLIMQLVEEGVLDLEKPVTGFGVDLESDGVINSWHLLTHTSAGVPGSSHSYDGNRYGYLGEVVEGASGLTFRQLLGERILSPLQMEDTAPNLILCPDDNEAMLTENPSKEADYLRVHQEMAKPYQLDMEYNVVSGDYQTIFSPAAGLISTVSDLARFDIALDQNLLLGPKTKEQMFEPLVSTYGDGGDLMYGLGWYSQEYGGTKLVWHAGRWPPSISALYVKVPEEDLTFILLANTANLSTPFPLGYGDVMYSAPAVAFFKHIVFPQMYGSEAPEIDWSWDQEALVDFIGMLDDEHERELLRREVMARKMALISTGRTAEALELAGIYDRLFEPATGPGLYTLSAAGKPPEGEPIELSQEELENFVGEFVLGERPSFLPPDEVPEEVSIRLVGELLVVCSGQEDGGLVLTPIAPDRLRTMGGPEGYMYFDVVFDGDEISALSAQLTEEIRLVYVPVKGT